MTERSNPVLSKEDVDAILKRAARLGADRVDLQGGRLAMGRVNGGFVPLTDAPMDHELLGSYSRHNIRGPDGLRSQGFATWREHTYPGNAERVTFTVYARADDARYNGVCLTAIPDAIKPPLALSAAGLRSEAARKVNLDKGGLILVSGRDRAVRTAMVDAMALHVLDRVTSHRTALRVAREINEPLAELMPPAVLLSQNVTGERNLKPEREDEILEAVLRGAGLTGTDAVFVDGLAGPESFRAAVRLARGGALVVAATEGADVPGTIRQVALGLPERDRRLLAYEFAEALSLVVATRTVPDTSGGQVPCHSCMAFETGDKETLHATDPVAWHREILGALRGGTTSPYETFGKAAERLRSEGTISDVVHDDIVRNECLRG